MTNFVIYGIGFTAQILFSLRFLIQWLKSEQRKQVMVPSSFWILSLIGTFLLFIYGYLRHDFAIMLGQTITYFIYIRNLHFQNKWQKIPHTLRYLIISMPLVFALFYLGYGNITILLKSETISTKVLALGVISQVIFSLRFVYQWMYSEMKKTSQFPLGFWLLSATGTILILIYAIYRKDPVLLVSHFVGLLVYSRNMMILKTQSTTVN